MTVFISRELSETTDFHRLLAARGWQVQGRSLVTLRPLPFQLPAERVDWVFFASAFGVKCFFEGAEGVFGSSPRVDPSPSPSPGGEGGMPSDKQIPLPPWGGVGGGVDDADRHIDDHKTAVEGYGRRTFKTDAARWKFLKTFVKANRQTQTEAESVLWKALRSRRFHGIKFRRQHAIEDFIADFVSLEYALVVEVDGEMHDFQVEYDQYRTEFLRVCGFHVIRFKNRDVMTSMALVLEKLWDFIQEIRAAQETPSVDHNSSLRVDPSPSPSPGGEGSLLISGHASLSPWGGAGGGVDTRGTSPQFAALGPATATALRHYVENVQFTGTGDPVSTAAAFRPLAAGRTVLFPAARHSQRSVPELLGAKIRVLHLAVYDNTPVPDPPLLSVDVLVLTSPLNAQAYFSRHPLQPHQKVVAIGPTTAAALRDLGISGLVVSPEPSERAMAEVVLHLRT